MTATYNLGLSYPLQSLLTAGFESNGFDAAGPLLLLGAPLVAIALNLLAVLRLEVGRERGDLVSTLRLRPSIGNLAVIGGAVALYATFALYLAAENWNCLTGAQATC